MNCLMDLFSNDFMVEPEPSLLEAAARFVVGLPLRAGAFVGATAWRCTQRVVVHSVRHACMMGALSAAGSAIGTTVRVSAQIAMFGPLQLCALGRMVFAQGGKPCTADSSPVLTEALLASPWTVVADEREGRLSVGDPVLEAGAEPDDKCAWRGTIGERCEDGFYMVESATRERRRLPQNGVKLDKSRVAAL